MQHIGFIGCIPERFEDEFVEVNLQFLERIFPKFSEKQKVSFVSAIHSNFEQRIKHSNEMMRWNKDNDELCNLCRKSIDDEIQKRDALLDRLGARDIVPEKLEINCIG
jgi:hypothetical protein